MNFVPCVKWISMEVMLTCNIGLPLNQTLQAPGASLKLMEFRKNHILCVGTKHIPELLTNPNTNLVPI